MSKNDFLGFSREIYFEHVLGMSCLTAWLTRLEGVRDNIEIKGPCIELGNVSSQRFCLGFPNVPRLGTLPFLCVQDHEEEFIRRMQWNNVWIDEDKSRLVLVSKKIMGDGDLIPDIPACSIGIFFDDVKKLDMLKLHKGFQARPLWFDEDNLPRVSGGIPFFHIPMRVFDPLEKSSYFEKNALSQSRTLLEISKIREERLALEAPEYKGGQVEVLDENFAKLLTPFDDKEIEKVRPK